MEEKNLKFGLDEIGLMYGCIQVVERSVNDLSKETIELLKQIKDKLGKFFTPEARMMLDVLSE